jgi:hypothetical protein
MFYDRPFDNLWQNVRANSVALAAFGLPGGSVDFLMPVSQALATYGNEAVDARFPDLTLLRGDLRNGYAHSAFIGIQQPFGSRWTAEVNGHLTAGRRLISTDAVNRTGDNPELPLISYRANQSFSEYRALTAVARWRGSRGQLHVAYTWGHTIDNQSEPLAGEFLDLSFSRVSSGGGRPVIAAFQRQFDSGGDRGASDFDQRQNLVAYSIWSLPAAFAGTRAGAVFRNWQVAQTAAFRSGFPYSVFAGGNAADTGDVYFNRRATLLRPDPAPATETTVPGGRLLLDRQAFLDPPDGGPGNTGRNAFRGPGLFNIDLSLSRRFALPWLGEAGRLTVRADAFNLLNHANLNSPDGFLGSPTFGQALYGRSGRDAGFPALTPFTETARQIQLLLRVEF